MPLCSLLGHPPPAAGKLCSTTERTPGCCQRGTTKTMPQGRASPGLGDSCVLPSPGLFCIREPLWAGKLGNPGCRAQGASPPDSFTFHKLRLTPFSPFSPCDSSVPCCSRKKPQKEGKQTSHLTAPWPGHFLWEKRASILPGFRMRKVLKANFPPLG